MELVGGGEPRPPRGGGGKRPAARTPGARLWVGAVLAVIPVAILAIGVVYVGRSIAGWPVPGALVAQTGLDWGLWALFAPLVVLFAMRHPLESDRWGRGIALHTATGLLVSTVELALFTAISRTFVVASGATKATFIASLGGVISTWLPYGLLVYWLLVIGTSVVLHVDRSRASEIEASELREALTRTTLDALRMQLHPHFLLNSLNTVAVLLEEGRGAEGREMILELGALLNRALATMDQEEIPLREELSFVRSYLEIERMRFPDRLRVTEEVEAATLGLGVPTMILQPLVENAMRHGIGADPRAGRLWLRARLDEGRLTLEVEDDGPGPRSGFAAPDRPPRGGPGVGLRNGARRLARLYGDEGVLSLIKGPAGGAIARVVVPARTAASPVTGSRAAPSRAAGGLS